MRRELFEALVKGHKGYLMSLINDSKSFHYTNRGGLLFINIDEREDIKWNYINPHLEGFDEFKSVVSSTLISKEDEDNIVIPFEKKSEEAMQLAEEQIVEYLINII